MTQLRSQRGAISNFFDRVLSGIGHRGSSFMDIDAVTHDGSTGRFLVQEFKQAGEAMTRGQYWMLRDLGTKLPSHFTVWMVRRLNDEQIEWADASDEHSRCVLTVPEYRQKFSDWWAHADKARAEAQAYQPVNSDMAAFCDAIRADAEKAS